MYKISYISVTMQGVDLEGNLSAVSFLLGPIQQNLSMSGLGSLFSGMRYVLVRSFCENADPKFFLFTNSADNNDALKYSAPKEPKQRAAKPAPAPVTLSTPSTFTSPAAVAARAPGPSKVRSTISNHFDCITHSILCLSSRSWPPPRLDCSK